MLKLRSLPSLASVALALSLATSGALTHDAQARAAKKAAAPDLSIESKACNIGPTEESRNATITASAILGSTGDRASMRFTIQQKQGTGAKARWRTVASGADSGLGTWQTGESGHTGLRYTKIINGLDEGVQYRIYVDARGVDSDGAVVTKTARKTVSCSEPLFTPTLALTKAVDTANRSGGGHTVTATITNAGRQPSLSPVVTVFDATTRAELGTVTADSGVKGSGTTKITVPISACTGPLYVTVQQLGAALTDLTPQQSATIDCGGAPASKMSAR